MMFGLSMPRAADFSLMEAETFLIIKWMVNGENIGNCNTKYMLFKYTAPQRQFFRPLFFQWNPTDSLNLYYSVMGSENPEDLLPNDISLTLIRNNQLVDNTCTGGGNAL